MAQLLGFGKKSMFIGALQGGVKKTSNIYFVDGLSGGDGGTYAVNGKNIDHAFKSVGKAISVADAFDVIYVMDRGTAATTDPDPYVEATANLTIAVAKQNLKLVGCPTNLDNPFMIQIKGHASVTATAVLTVYAPMCSIENLSFNRGASTLGGILLRDEGDGIYSAQGTTVSNCHFKNLRSAAAASTMGGGVIVYGGWNYTIKGCFFDDCRCGVWVGSGSASTVKWLRILDSKFAGTTTNRDVDIYQEGVITASTIDKCVFAGLPAYGGGGATARFHVLVGDGVISNCAFGGANALTWAAAGTGGFLATTFMISGCFKEGALIAHA